MYFSREQVRRVDRLAIERYHIPGIVLMENTAIAAANLASQLLANTPPSPHSPRLGHADAQPRDILILCGGGNNGGDGLAVARHLHNARHHVQLALTIDPAKYTGDALVNWRITQAMQLPTENADAKTITASKADLIIDAIFGTGLTAAPRPPFADIASAVIASGRPVLAIDIPSGLDCDTGQPLGEAIPAIATITFVAEKKGFANPQARKFTGAVTTAPIGCPTELIAQIAAEANP